MEIGCYLKWVVLLCVDTCVWLAVKQHHELLWLCVVTNMVVFEGETNTTTINPWLRGVARLILIHCKLAVGLLAYKQENFVLVLGR